MDQQPSNDVVCDCADTDIGVRRELELDITIWVYVSKMFRVKHNTDAYTCDAHDEI